MEVPRCTLRPKEGMSMLFLRLFVPEHLVLDDKLFLSFDSLRQVIRLLL